MSSSLYSPSSSISTVKSRLPPSSSLSTLHSSAAHHAATHAIPYSSPYVSATEQSYFRAEQAKLMQTEQDMKKCELLTNQILGILDHFDTKLSNLESAMLPIHKGTQHLTTAQKNIDACIVESDRILTAYNIANESEESCNDRHSALSSDYKGYLEWVERINSAGQFFAKNASFKNADKYIKKLRDLSKRAMSECEREYERVLQSHSKAVDISRIGWPIPDSFVLLPAAAINELSMLALRMNASGDKQFLVITQSLRGATLKQSLKNAIKDGTNANSADDEKTADKVGRYAKGSHRIIFYLQLFLKLLELEHEVLRQLLSYSRDAAKESVTDKERVSDSMSAAISHADFDSCFVEMVAPAMEYFIKTCESMVKEKSVNKVLITLDILENLNQLLPRYRVVLKQNDQFNHLLDFQQQVTTACRKAISDYKEYVMTDSEGMKNKQQDGTIYTLTIETLNFLKRLYEYNKTINNIPRSMLSDENNEEDEKGNAVMASAALDNSAAGGTIIELTQSILSALESNLEQKAKSYKLASLSAIFLLNNFHYIAKFIKQRGRSEFLQGSYFLDRYESLVRQATEQYRSVSWDKALAALDMSDSKEILTKCVPTVQKGAKKAIKGKFSTFNTVFEELYATQRHFSIPDADLRSKLRLLNIDLILPQYRTMYTTYANVDFTSHTNKYTKYAPDRLEQMLNKFFDEEND